MADLAQLLGLDQVGAALRGNPWAIGGSAAAALPLFKFNALRKFINKPDVGTAVGDYLPDFQASAQAAGGLDHLPSGAYLSNAMDEVPLIDPHDWSHSSRLPYIYAERHDAVHGPRQYAVFGNAGDYHADVMNRIEATDALTSGRMGEYATMRPYFMSTTDDRMGGRTFIPSDAAIDMGEGTQLELYRDSVQLGDEVEYFENFLNDGYLGDSGTLNPTDIEWMSDIEQLLAGTNDFQNPELLISMLARNGNNQYIPARLDTGRWLGMGPVSRQAETFLLGQKHMKDFLRNARIPRGGRRSF